MEWLGRSRAIESGVWVHRHADMPVVGTNQSPNSSYIVLNKTSVVQSHSQKISGIQREHITAGASKV